MAVEARVRELSLRASPTPGRVRCSVGGLARHPEREAPVEAGIGRLDGIKQVRASSLTGNVLVVFDPNLWTPEQLVQEGARALGLRARRARRPAPATVAAERPAVVSSVVPGRLRIAVPGLRGREEMADRVERSVGDLDGVRDVRANPRTGNALVLFDPEVWAAEELVAVCAQAAVGPADVRAGPRSRRATSPPRATTERRNGAAPAPAATSLAAPGIAPPSDDVPWHALSAPQTLERLGVDPDGGLEPAEVEARRRQFGPNRMPEPAEPSSIKLFVDQLMNAPTALLAAGALVSVATGGLIDAVLIGGVLLINAGVGAATERSGQRAIAALRQSAAIPARVRRGGDETTIDADALVPGDVVQLLPGDPVPADARLIAAHRLQLEESALTGESRPILKQERSVEERFGLADRRSMVHRGTMVAGGRGSAIVVATGPRTAIGALHALAAEAEAPPTPMERDLALIGRGLAIGATVVCGGVFGLGVLRGFGMLYGLEVAVSLGVAAIPEGLPALATSVLAFASGRMRRRGTLIRSLGAAEALGSVTHVCADKTGTLTENRMAARELFAGRRVVEIGGQALAPRGELCVDGEPIDPARDQAVASSLLVGCLCSDAEVEGVRDGQLALDGSATEGALLVAAVKAGLDPAALREANPRIDLRDRSDGRRHMVTVHRGEDGPRAMLKGAPDEVLAMCDTVELGDGPPGDGPPAEAPSDRPLDEPLRSTYADRNAEMAARAMRVLALAHKRLPEGYAEDDLQTGYTLSGLIGLVDPIRPAAPPAIKALHRAGIRTIMITGDQALTATAVARELGLSRRGSLNVLEAGDLALLDGEALRGLVRDVGIFARVAPEMKLQVVRALQANGNVVAMTGDGVNDGPALRAADVGVAMGERGSELARELADVVLSTDDIARIVDAVEEGRLVRANVRRVLHYLLSTNASEVWAVAGAVALGLPSPLTPLQLLWLNLVTDLAPGLALALEPRDPDLMQQPPRDPKEPIIPGPMLRRLLAESAVIAGGALAVYGVGIARHGIGPVAQTMGFASLLGSQLVHVMLARAGDRPALAGSRDRGNPTLALAMAGSAGLQMASLFFPPLRAALGGAPLALGDLGVAVLGALLPSALVEASRWLSHGGLRDGGLLGGSA